MTDNFQYDVFLSHSAKDKAVVRPLAERLRKDELNAGFDDEKVASVSGGKRQSASEFQPSAFSLQPFLELSANAFGSDWAQLACPAGASARRRKAGTFRFRDPLNKERRFIPRRFDDAPVKRSFS